MPCMRGRIIAKEPAHVITPGCVQAQARHASDAGLSVLFAQCFAETAHYGMMEHTHTAYWPCRIGDRRRDRARSSRGFLWQQTRKRPLWR